MNETTYLVVIGILVSVSGVTLRYLFNKITKASELYAKEFIRVDRELDAIRAARDMHCQKCDLQMAGVKEEFKHREDKLYDHGNKLAVLISRIEKLEFRTE